VKQAKAIISHEKMVVAFLLLLGMRTTALSRGMPAYAYVTDSSARVLATPQRGVKVARKYL
jgi:hypothetical protein